MTMDREEVSSPVEEATMDGDAVPVESSRAERLGRRLQWATIAWNLGEVFVTVALGVAAGSLALIAFGLDSLVEVFASLVVVWHMSPGHRDDRERRDRRALRLVAIAFAVLAVYLVAASARSMALAERPTSSPVGIAYLGATAGIMFALARMKRRIGGQLHSEPFLAEASMTFLDGCLAGGILVALVLNTVLGWWWTDPLAALLVGIIAAREARDRWREASIVT
jgi:divalent metal cation (Fe/Co/Zn/Cd) transporter